MFAFSGGGGKLADTPNPTLDDFLPEEFRGAKVLPNAEDIRAGRQRLRERATQLGWLPDGD